jgi:hypothetical protein
MKIKTPYLVITVILVLMLVMPILQNPASVGYASDGGTSETAIVTHEDFNAIPSADNPDLEIEALQQSLIIIEVAENLRLFWVVTSLSGAPSGWYEILEDLYDDYPEDEGEWFDGQSVYYPLEFLRVGTYSIRFRAYGDPMDPNVYDQHVTTVIVNPVDATPPTLSSPEDITMMQGTDVSVVWYADDEHPDDYVTLVGGGAEDTGHWQSGEPIRRLLSDLSAGTHTVSCYVRDSSHNEVRDHVTVTVLPDTEPPLLSDAPDQSFLQGANVFASWDADDDNPGTFTITEDGVPVVEEVPWTAGPSIEWPLSHLTLGTHEVVCTVYDQSGNSASDSMVATVFDVHPDIVVQSLNESEVTIITGEGGILQWVVESQVTSSGEYTIRSVNPENGEWLAEDSGYWSEGIEITLGLNYFPGVRIIDFRAIDPVDPLVYAQSLTTVTFIADHPDISLACLNGTEVFVEVGETAALQWSIESDYIYEGLYGIEWFLGTDWGMWDTMYPPYIASFNLVTSSEWTYTVTMRAYGSIFAEGPFDQVVTVVHVLPAPSYHIDISANHPSLVTMECEGEEYLEWVVWSDLSDTGHYEIEVDDVYYTGNAWERLQPIHLFLSFLSEGTHTIQFTAWTEDWYWSEQVLTTILVSPIVETPPTISDAPDVTVIEGSDVPAVWYPEDDNPGTYVIIEDGDVAVDGVSWTSGDPIEYSLSHLVAGAHEIVCQVYDGDDLMASDTVRVAVGFVVGGPYPTESGEPLFTLSILAASFEEAPANVERAVWFAEDLREIGIECVIYPLPHQYWFPSVFYAENYGLEKPSPSGAPSWLELSRDPHFNHLLDEGVMWCGSYSDLVTPPGYGNNWDDVLMKEFQLSEGSVELSYSIQYDSEYGYDFIYVQISDDGGDSWETLESLSGTSSGYESYAHDISGYAGKTVLVRFNFISDAGVSDADGFDTEGACRIDWVSVTGYPTDEFTDGPDGWAISAPDALLVEGFDVAIAAMNPPEGYRPGFEYIPVDYSSRFLDQGYCNAEYEELVHDLVALDVDWNGNFPDPPDLSQEVIDILYRLQEIWVEEHPFWVMWGRDYWESGDIRAGWVFALPNLGNGDLAINEVRQAISLAMDRQGMIDNGMPTAPRVWPVQTPIHPMNPGFDPISYAEYDVFQARAMLLAAGYSDITADIEAPVLQSLPEDVTVTESSSAYIYWDATDESPGVYTITDNGIPVIESEPWSNGAIMFWLSNLDAGTHEITIDVYDLAGNCVSDTVLVEVTPAIRLTTPAQDVHVEYYHDFADGWYHVIYFYSEYAVTFLDASWFSESGWNGIWNSPTSPEEEGWISLGQTQMNPVGTYPQTLEIVDAMGNRLYVEFSIIVEDTRSPEWIVEPEDLTVNYGDFEFDFSVWDASGVSASWISDTTNFVLGVDTISTAHPLDLGEYPLVMEFLDPYGNVLTKEITIYVQDLTAPEWVEEPISMYVLEFGDTLSVHFEVRDYSEPGAVTVSDTDSFEVVGLMVTTGVDWIYAEGSLNSIGMLPVGVYSVELQIEDLYGNILSTVIVVVVQDTTAPVPVVNVQHDVTYTRASQVVGSVRIEDLSEVSYVRIYESPGGLDGLYLSDIARYTYTTSTGTINIFECSIATSSSLEPGEHWFTLECQDIHGNTWLEEVYIRCLRQLEMRLIGDFDYLEKEDIPITLAVYLWCPETNEPITGATVSLSIINQDLDLLVSAEFIDYGFGWYRWTSDDTIANLKTVFTKGIYTVGAYVSTSYTDFYWDASDLMEFHIDPPGAGDSDTLLVLSMGGLSGLLVLDVVLAAVYLWKRRVS